MDWSGGRRSDNVEDDRGSGMGKPLLMGGGVLSVIGGIIFYLITGQSPSGTQDDPRDRQVNTAPVRHGPSQGSIQRGTTEDFVSVVLASTEDTWPRVLSPQGVRYVPPRLVLFTDAVESACGFAQSAVGPFYCPPDSKVYLDTGFFQELRRLGGPGEFAEAYVIAHEVGHHVQNLLGISNAVTERRRRADRTQSNALSVLTELQADCYAGIWAHHANDQRRLIQPGDTEEGFAAAASIGDDRLQRRAQGRVAPESFTHGSSQQRVEWFRRGLEQGTLESCDTFGRSGIHFSRQ